MISDFAELADLDSDSASCATNRIGVGCTTLSTFRGLFDMSEREKQKPGKKQSRSGARTSAADRKTRKSVPESTQPPSRRKRYSPLRTRLDGELLHLSLLAKQEARLKNPIPLGMLASRCAMAAGATKKKPVIEMQPGKQITLKLVAKAGHQRALAGWVEKHGGVVTSEAPMGNVLVANLPLSSIGQLDAVAELQRAEAARVLLPRLDEARGPVTGLADAVATHSLTGDGVVFGIVDSGLDWSHPDFQDAASDTRLELFTHALYDQQTDTSQFDDFDADQINAAMAGTGNVSQGDPHGHGTHCASIAVGNGNGSGGTFAGVAPDAAIMAMRSEPLLDTHTIRGIREFFRLAEDRPAVVSLSLGGHVGPHDGTSAIENVIAHESGPGRIVVVAAGNEGADRIHWRGQLFEEDEIVIPIRIADSELQWTDVWIPRGDEVDITIETPDGNQFDADGAIHQTVFGEFIADLREDPVNRDQNMTLRVFSANVNHTWNIRIAATRVLHGDIHAWGHTLSPGNASTLFPGSNDTAFSVGMPGTEERAIVVGSFVSKRAFDTTGGGLQANGLTVGQLSPFSSRGPTRIGKQKPDIAAPGQYITAALSNNSEFMTNADYMPRHHPTNGYITIQGTSMATPFVAGVIALMLEREPTLTPEEIQQRMRVTASRDDDTGRVWDEGFGYGKIDVAALLDYTG